MESNSSKCQSKCKTRTLRQFLTKKLSQKLSWTISIFTSNKGPQENWGFDHCSSRVSGKGIEMVNVSGNAGQDSGSADQRVESSNQLRQVSNFDLLGNGRSWKNNKFRQV